MFALRHTRSFALHEAPSEFGRGLPLPAFRPIPEAAERFDYDALPEAVANEARAAADQIRGHAASAARSFVAVGQALTRIKTQLGHGDFLVWVRCEFGLNPRTAQNYMSVSSWLDESKYEPVSHLKQRTLYALSSPSTPTAVREAVIRDIERGTSPSDSEIEARISAAKPVHPATDPAVSVIVEAHAIELESDASDDCDAPEAAADASPLDEADRSLQEPMFANLAAELTRATRHDALDALDRMDAQTFVRHLRAALEKLVADEPAQLAPETIEPTSVDA